MKKIRVLIAKLGLDGHDRGALVVSQALRDHGMEVIYTGLRQSPEQIVQAAIQEDVDLIGLSSLSGAHNTLFPRVMEELRKYQAGDIPVIAGGVIPKEDIAYLKEKGIKEVFTSGASTELLASYIRQLLDPKSLQEKPPRRIAHIGVAVRRIEEALEFYVHQLGLELQAIEKIEREGVQVAFLSLGDSYIELLEPLNDTSVISKFIQSRGEGIHHIALEVDHLDQRIKNLREYGIQMVEDEAVPGAIDSRIAFIHPKSTHGVLLELCEFKREGE